MTACQACSFANPAGARFCMNCGAPVIAAAATRDERKVVTALFCDLVGFTATAEGADPEDVDSMLTRYFNVVRAQIEAHGGVVEKFIGDAVVGVFGVPVAHEDDAERAVRAALRIADDADGLDALGGTPLRLRIGINTGETLVRLGVDPGAGERFLAGDTINTASRIQSVAPEMGVAVGLATYEATKRQFVFDELPSAVLKGKADPVRVFHAREPRARLGVDLTSRASMPFIGRTAELGAILELFERAVAGHSIRFASVVGEPGLGKSRLVAEVLAAVDARPQLVTWRQGRCLPYGTGISFWALGEIVKAHAGILDSDPAAVASEKLERVLPDGDERAWLRERLLPLLGLAAGGRAEREEQFQAWRRFLELLAAQRPTVIVFEDLHWADEAMLSFLEELVERSEGVPLLVIGTARPELFERRPEFPGKKAHAKRIDLRPLPEDDSTRLVASLLEPAAISSDLRELILERSGGNPLFAEELIHFLRDRDLLISGDEGIALRANATLPIPGSIHALIAGRIDSLPPDWKAVLADAAVVGKVFWAGALAAIGERDRADVDQALDGLTSRQFVLRAARSSMAAEAEFAFRHILARDVAYAALPRSARVVRHAAIARWIEGQAADRVEDVADVVAHHYTEAIDLARAVGDDTTAAGLEAPAARFLLMAGERALSLDTPMAIAHLERALELTPPGHPSRPDVQSRYGMAMKYDGRFREAVIALDEALDGFRATGDAAAVADTIGKLSPNLRELGDARSLTHPRDSVEILEQLGPSRALADALVMHGFVLRLTGHFAESVRALDRAEAVVGMAAFAREADAIATRGSIIGTRGLTRAEMGDRGGLAEIREAIELTTAAGHADQTAHLYNNLAFAVASFDGDGAALEEYDRGLAFATSRGLRGHVPFFQEARLLCGFDLGHHDELIAGIPELDATFASYGSIVAQVEVRSFALRVATLRGELVDPEMLSWLVSVGRRSGDPDNLIGLAAAAPAHLLRGESSEAIALLEELSQTAGTDRGMWWFARFLPSLIRTALELRDLGLARALVSGFEPRTPYGEHASAASTAALLEAEGDLAAAAAAYSDAADRWRRLSVVPERAFALAGQGRCLIELERRSDGLHILGQARPIFESMRATPMLTRLDALMDGGGR